MTKAELEDRLATALAEIEDLKGELEALGLENEDLSMKVRYQGDYMDAARIVYSYHNIDNICLCDHCREYRSI